MPDGNAPSRSPSAPDEARAPSSQVPVPPAPKPAAPATPAPKLRAVRGGASTASQPAPAPADQLTRLDTLRKQLIEARSSGLPLTELLKAYDKELFAIAVATTKHGGLSPLSAKEEVELRRVEEAREALAEAREDDPRARAKALAEQLKRAQQSNAKPSANQTAALEARQEAANAASPTQAPNTINLRALRQELKFLQEEAWTNGLTRELNRTPGASITDLEKALEQAERAEKTARTTEQQPQTTPEATPEETPAAPDTATPSSEPPSEEEDVLDAAPDADTDSDFTNADLTASLATSTGIAGARVALRQTNDSPEVPTTSESLPPTDDEAREIAELNRHFDKLAGSLMKHQGLLLRYADVVKKEADTLNVHELDDESYTDLRQLRAALDAYANTLNELSDESQKKYRAFSDRFIALASATPEDRRASLEERRAIVNAFAQELGGALSEQAEQAEAKARVLLEQQSTVLDAAYKRAQTQQDWNIVASIERVQAGGFQNTTELYTQRLGASLAALQGDIVATSELEQGVDATTESIITQARAELRATYATRQREQAILTTYRTRLTERSWSYLQTHEPAQFQRLQSIQTQLNIQIDPSTTLTSSELEPLHLQAVADTRAEFPDLTDAVLSALLLKQAGASIAGAAAIQATGNAAVLDAALGAATVGAAATAGIVAAGITGAGLIAGHALQQREAEQAAQDLTREEAQIKTRTVQLAQTPTSEASQVGADLRQAQQTSTGKRRGLQAKLGVRLQQLDAWNSTLKAGGATGATGANGASGLSPAMLGMLAIVSPKTLKQATIRPEAKPTPSSDSPSDTLKFNNTTQRLRREDGRDEHQKAAHLDSVKARTKVALPSMGGSSRASSVPASSSSSSFASSEEAPLLTLSPAPKTREEAFARRQTLMNRTRDQFSGAGASSGGYEAMFGLAPLAATDTDTDQDGAALNSGSLPEDEGLDAVTQDFIDEQMREAELRRRQQLDAQQNDQGDTPQEGGGKNGMVNKQNIQRAQQAAKALRTGAAGTAGVVLAAVLVVVLIIWLNIRLFFPNPESSWRKPLGAFGKIGTVVMDFLVFTFALTQFLMVVATLLIPLAIVALPGAIIAATLMRVLGN